MRLFNRVALAPVLLLVVSQVTFAQFQYPRSGGGLNDFAGKLTPTTRQRLETNVTEFQRRSGIDLRVVTIPLSDLRGRPIEQYSMGLARLWAVGRNSGSRGLLLLVAIGSQDKGGIYHGTTRLEVSRNLERDIPNNVANELTSRMRQSLMAGWFDEALTIGVDGVVSAIDQKQRETRQNNAPGQAPQPAPRSQNSPAAALASSRSTPDIFGFVILLMVLGVPAIIIALVIRGIARKSGPGYPAGRGRWTGRGRGIGVGTGIALSGTDWNRDSSNSVSMDSSSATWVDSTSTSSWTDSSSSGVSDSGSSFSDSSSSSFSDSSSSSSSDSSSSSSSGGDFGGGGSTDSW